MKLLQSLKRRRLIQSLAAGSAFAFLRGAHSAHHETRLKGRIKQCVTRGFWRKVPWEEFLPTIKAMGIVGVDLVGQGDWDVVRKHGLIASMVPGAGGIKHGLNETERHPQFMEDFKKNIKAAADYGWSNVITFSGERYMSDEEGLDNCHLILKEAVKIAEDHDVTICMELLNSKVDHPGYMCDKSAWGFELCRRVGSPSFKMLYDIYHMQIMEGDIIRTIRDNIDHIGHFHTAGNPGRKDMDDEQELNYTGIMRAIARLSDEGRYKGFVAHEFGPKHKFDSLRQAVEICDV